MYRDGEPAAHVVADHNTGSHHGAWTPEPTEAVVVSDDDTDLQAYTVRLELVDEPGELLRALHPIADGGGNLLSIFHERGNLTPRGNIPVEVDFECPPHRFDPIVEDLRAAGVNVVQAGTDRYSEEATVLLVGHLIDTDLSGTLDEIQNCAGTTIHDMTLAAGDGPEDPSSARLRLAADHGRLTDALSKVQEIAERKDFRVIEPVTTGSGQSTDAPAAGAGSPTNGGSR